MDALLISISRTTMYAHIKKIMMITHARARIAIVILEMCKSKSKKSFQVYFIIQICANNYRYVAFYVIVSLLVSSLTIYLMRCTQKGTCYCQCIGCLMLFLSIQKCMVRLFYERLHIEKKRKQKKKKKKKRDPQKLKI